METAPIPTDTTIIHIKNRDRPESTHTERRNRGADLQIVRYWVSVLISSDS